MSQRVERMIKDYPSMVMERDCLRHQLANFRGVTEEEIIDSMNFSSPQGERVQTSNIFLPFRFLPFRFLLFQISCFSRTDRFDLYIFPDDCQCLQIGRAHV